jgi:hypothetical protein
LLCCGCTPADGPQHDSIDVLPCGGGRLHLVESVQTVMFVQVIKEEGVRVLNLDVLHKGDTSQFCSWALPPLEDCIGQYYDLGGCGIVEINLVVIIDCCLASFDHFDSTEEGIADEGWDNVDTVSRLLRIVVQLVDHGCCHCGSIWKMKHGH